MSLDFLVHFTPERVNTPEAQARNLKKACQEFESLFWEQLLKGMRKTVTKGGILGNRFEEELFTSMHDQELSVQLSRRGGLGLAETLMQKLTPEKLKEEDSGE